MGGCEHRGHLWANSVPQFAFQCQCFSARTPLLSPVLDAASNDVNYGLADSAAVGDLYGLPCAVLRSATERLQSVIANLACVSALQCVTTVHTCCVCGSRRTMGCQPLSWCRLLHMGAQFRLLIGCLVHLPCTSFVLVTMPSFSVISAWVVPASVPTGEPCGV